MRRLRPVAGTLWTAAAAAIAWLPLTLLLTLAAACALVALPLAPVVGLAAAAWAVPFGSLAPLPLGAGALTAAPPLLLITAVAVGIRWLPGRRSDARWGTAGGSATVTWITAAWASYILVMGASAWRAPSPIAATFEGARWITFGLAAGLTMLAAKDRRSAQLLTLALLAAAATQAAVGLWWSVRGTQPEAFAILGGRLFRASGTFGQPNPFGGYMNMAWPLGAALLAERLLPGRRRNAVDDPVAGERPAGARPTAATAVGGTLNHATAASARSPEFATHGRVPIWLAGAGAVAAALCGAGLIASWSRGAWLAALAGAAALISVRLVRALRTPGDRRPLGLAWLTLVALLGLATLDLLPGAPAQLVDRLATVTEAPALDATLAQAEVTDANFSTVERLAHWVAALRMFEERPWLGQGPGHYELTYADHHLPRWSAPLGHAHNYYLHALAETGLLGAVAFLAFLASVLGVCAYRAVVPTDALRGALALGAVGVWTTVAVHSMVDNLFVHEMTIHLGLLTGVALGAPIPWRSA